MIFILTIVIARNSQVADRWQTLAEKREDGFPRATTVELNIGPRGSPGREAAGDQRLN